MILLDGENTGWQEFVTTLQEAILWQETPTHYLFELENMASATLYYFIADVIETNPRYTMARVNIATQNPTQSSVEIEERGLFRYTIYGQDSSTNLDPEDGSVIGVAETGILRITGEEIGTMPDLDIPNNVIYYE